MFASTLMQFASAHPFNATTGLDNHGDGANNDRPVVHVIGPGEQAPHNLALRADGSHLAARVHERLRVVRQLIDDANCDYQPS
ncbi:MAG TPA: hypothetical protein VNC21_18115 [Vicinamibacterales bacterium]|nr:hypothetical protein [Vicinamibacterales bacterium]